MNVWDVIIIAIIAGGVFLAIRTARKGRKTGGCSCGCEGCRKTCDRK